MVSSFRAAFLRIMSQPLLESGDNLRIAELADARRSRVESTLEPALHGAFTRSRRGVDRRA